MSEVITLSFLEKFVNKKIPLPSNYKLLVLNYLRIKNEHLNRLRTLGKDTTYCEFDLVEGIRLAKRLGIHWILK